jgi:hypothetical protein
VSYFPFMSIKKVVPYICLLHEGYYVIIWLIVRICVSIKTPTKSARQGNLRQPQVSEISLFCTLPVLDSIYLIFTLLTKILQLYKQRQHEIELDLPFMVPNLVYKFHMYFVIVGWNFHNIIIRLIILIFLILVTFNEVPYKYAKSGSSCLNVLLAFGFHSVAIYMKFIHKVWDHERQVKFNFMLPLHEGEITHDCLHVCLLKVHSSAVYKQTRN